MQGKSGKCGEMEGKMSNALIGKPPARLKTLNVNEICCKSVGLKVRVWARIGVKVRARVQEALLCPCQTAQSVSVSGCWPHN